MNNIEKRGLGKSNLEVSRLCYGTLAFSVYHADLPKEKAAQLLLKAYELGVNFWDTAELYETYGHLNFALKTLKELNCTKDIVISSRSYAKTNIEMKKSLEKCLNELELAQIDIFGLHEVQKVEFDGLKFRADAFEVLVDAKKNNLIKAVSITTHSAKVVDLAAEIDEVDVIMPLINYKGIGVKDGDLKDMELAIQKAKNKNKGVYAMKALAGGAFSDNIRQALDYIIKSPDIDSVAIGMDSIDEILFNSSVFLNQEKSSELEEKLKSKKRKLYVEPWCAGCEKCSGVCPQNAIIMEFGQAKIIEDKCVRCGYCISACKDFYIKFLNNKEL